MRGTGPGPIARNAGVLLLALLLLAACESFIPLREPPANRIESPPGDATTRAEVLARYGPPQEVRASDVGDVLVYRRRVIVEANPARYSGGESSDRLDRFERVMIYLDGDGKIVHVSSELE